MRRDFVRAVDQHRDRLLVTEFRRPLDVMRVRARGSMEAGEGDRGARVRTELPRARCAVVDGPADDGVPEAEVPGGFGGADEVGRQELVEPDLHGRLRQFRDEGDEPGHERLAGDRGGIRGSPRVGRQCRELGADRGRDRRWRRPSLAGIFDRQGTARCGGVARPHELFEVERVAAALVVEQRPELGVEGGIDQRLGLLLGERRELQPAADAGAHRHVERHREARGRVPVRERSHHRPPEAPEHVRDHLDRRRVRPLHVVDDHDHRPSLGQAFEEGADRVVDPVALGLQAGRGQRVDGRGQRGEDGGELAERLRRRVTGGTQARASRSSR